ncbi:MAG: YgjV family protein [Ruminococcaceae bacterium]|nr:YgjV family protein [Oscillospiraceae bacterium]
MDCIDVLAQGLGLVGMVLTFCSFQAKKNSGFFVLQGLSGLAFALNFLLIGAYAGCAMNAVNVIRGLLFKNGDKKKYKLVVVELLYALSVLLPIMLSANGLGQIILSIVVLIAQLSNSVVMWMGSGKHIRYLQFALVSPAWLVYDVVNFSLGGILCEAFNMISVVVSFIRYGKDGFEK